MQVTRDTKVYLIHCGQPGCLPDYTDVLVGVSEAKAFSTAKPYRKEYPEVDVQLLYGDEAISLGWIDEEGNPDPYC